MYKLNTASTIKKMTIKELREFIHENYYSQIEFTKENSHYSIKRQKKNFVSFTTKLIEKIQKNT